MSDKTGDKAEQSQGAAAPASNGGKSEPSGTTGGDRSTPTAPAQANEPRAGTRSPEQGSGREDELVDRYFAKGARAGKRELFEEIEQEHGAPLKTILDEWKGYRESAAKGEKAESAEVTKLQRQLAQHSESVKAKDAKLTELLNEVNGYKVTQPVQAAVRRVGPKSERYETILVAEMQRRVKLDDDGELTVLSTEGKPQHKLTLDDLAKEIAEAMPDLVTPPRAGTGVKPGSPVVQSRESLAANGAGSSRAERIAALARMR